MIRINLNFETIGSICAIITSFAALFVAWDQSVVMRAQQHASVWPIITTDISINQNDDHSYVQFDIVNVGVGPAIVKNGNLFINDTIVSGYQDFQDKLLIGSLKSSVSIETSSLIGFVGAGARKTVLKLAWDRNAKNDQSFEDMVAQFVAKGTKLKISQCYCSVFAICYEAGLGLNNGPQEVASCAIQDIDPSSRIMESVNTD